MNRALLISIVLLFLGGCNDGKIIDPHDPRFDPMQFQFEDYNDSEITLHEVYKVMFPVGTPKHRVDEILIKQAGAVSKLNSGHNNYVNYYKSGFTNLTGWVVNIKYDKKLNLENIKRGKLGYLYPEGKENEQNAKNVIEVDSIETASNHVVLEPLIFNFDENEIQRVYKYDDSIKSTSVSLIYLLPNFQTQKQAKIELKPSNSLRIHINVRPDQANLKNYKSGFSYDTSAILKNRFDAKMPFSEEKRLPEIKNGILKNNLYFYKNRSDDQSSKDVYLDKKINPNIVLECFDDSWPNSNCKYSANLRAGVDMFYLYPKEYVYMATEIHEFVVEKIKNSYQGDK